jgi:hypothetical protein
MILRMILMAASCPSNKLAAVTIRTLFLRVKLIQIILGPAAVFFFGFAIIMQKDPVAVSKPLMPFSVMKVNAIVWQK